MKIKLLAAVFMVTLLFAPGCAETAQENEPAPVYSATIGNVFQPTRLFRDVQNEPLSKTVLHLLINGEPVELPLARDGARFDAPTLNAEQFTRFELLNKGNFTVTINGTQINEGDILEMPVERIASGLTIDICASDGYDSRTVHINTRHSAIPAFTVAGQSPYAGDYYLSFTETPLVMKLDSSGNILYYRCPGPDNGLLTDFQKHETADGVFYSYLETTPIGTGTRVIMDESYAEIARVDGRSIGVNGFTPDGGFIMLGSGHYIVAGTVPEIVRNVPDALSPNPLGSSVYSAMILEVDNGRTAFEWKSSDHPELYELVSPSAGAIAADFANKDAQYADYARLSSICLDPADGGLICAFRNLDSILKIGRDDGEISWVLSGAGDQFGLEDEEKTSGLSFACTTGDGRLAVFDNGSAGAQSRVLLYKLDEANKALLEVSEYSVAGRYSPSGGAVSLLDSDTQTLFIGWGENKTVLSEIDFSQKAKLLEITLDSSFPGFAISCYKIS